MRALKLLLLALFALPTWAQHGAEAVEPQTVTVGISHAPPYRMVEDDVRSGLYVDVFEAITAHLGWTVRYREAPIRRALLLIQQGEVDVVLGPRRTADREQYLDYAIPAFPSERRLFFYQTGTQRIERYEDLYGRIIGVVEGASYFPRFDADEKILKEFAPRYENLMLMLERGRVDVVVAPELVGQYTANRQGLRVSVSPFSVPGERRYIAVSKYSPIHDYVDDLRNALELDELDAIYREHAAKYLGESAQ